MSRVGPCSRSCIASFPDPAAYPGFSRRFSVLRILLILAAPVFTQEQNSNASGRQPSEYDVKAAYLLNFIKFVQWPSSAESPNRPFGICIVGDDPFGATLDHIVEGEQVNDRRLEVRRGRQQPGSCEVLFVSKSVKEVPEVLREAGRGALTVGETDDFLREGGIISFVIENRRVRFVVNQKAATNAGLQLSSRLLNVARSVEK
jgi:hypothetical protein